MLNPCTTWPDKKKRVPRRDCMDEIMRAYPGMSVLGWGAFAVTLLVISPDQKEVVLKLAYLDPVLENTTEEIAIGCMVSSMRLRTPIFGEMYGWQYCTGIPDKWRQIIRETLRQKDPRFAYDDDDEDDEDTLSLQKLFMKTVPVQLIAMEHNGTPFEKMVLTTEEQRQILFLLLHGLLMVRGNHISFRHNDIHEANILLKVRDPSKPLALRLPFSGDPIELHGVTYIPRLIDYGFAKLWNPPETQNSDLFMLRVLFAGTGENFLVDMYEKKRPFDESVLLEPLFESFVNVQRKRVRVESFCQQCFSAPATIQHAKDASRVYCGEKCFVKSNKLF